MHDIASTVGLGVNTKTYSAVVFDYDRDGWQDVFLGRHELAAALYRNDDGRFVNTNLQFPQKTDRHNCAAGDVNRDLRRDLFCTVGGADGIASKLTPNQLLIQTADGTFTDRGGQADLADPWGRGRRAALFDLDRDGDLDLYVGNASPRSDEHLSPNRLFVNEGPDGWRSAPELGLDHEWSVGGSVDPNWPQGCLEVFDADGDGWRDILLCVQDPGKTDLHMMLLHNDHGQRFVDVSAQSGLDGVAWDAAVTDIDGDGDRDVVSVKPRALEVWLQSSGVYTLAYSRGTSLGLRVAVGDANGDLQPDIYFVRSRALPAPDIGDRLLINNGAPDSWTAYEVPIVDDVDSRGDDVYPIDVDRDGRSEFLVLNGMSPYAAPIQLISFS